MQFDQGKRGFSFSKEAPLDMRMDLSEELTAKKVVNSWPEKKLGELFRDMGEEPKWKQAAKAIIQARGRHPIETTTELASIVTEAVGRGKKRLHPATLVFQALRICVNRELESIQKGVQKALGFLNIGGRIGVISFHSLEDRIIKTLFREAAKPLKQLAGYPQFTPIIELLTKKPLVPSRKEQKMNARARSAKLRFAEKILP